MKRREFIEALGLGAAGALIASNTATAEMQLKNKPTKQRIEFAKALSDHSTEVRLTVRCFHRLSILISGRGPAGHQTKRTQYLRMK